MKIEEAKEQYQIAWDEYRTNFDIERKQELENLMDQAQDYFTEKEFYDFKFTLEGYVEYWEFMIDKCKAMLKEDQNE